MTCGIRLNQNAISEQDPLFLNCTLERDHREDHKWEDHEVTIKKMTLFNTIQKIINPNVKELNYFALEFDHWSEEQKIAFGIMIIYTKRLQWTMTERLTFLAGLTKSTSWFMDKLTDIETFTSNILEIISVRDFK